MLPPGHLRVNVVYIILSTPVGSKRAIVNLEIYGVDKSEAGKRKKVLEKKGPRAGLRHKGIEDSTPNPAPPRSGTVSGLKAPPPGTAQRLVVQEESNTLWVLGPAAPGKI